MRIVITGGGTGGHVSPAVAVIEELRVQSQREGWPLDILYIGSKSGVERETISRMGLPYKSVPVGKLRRYLSVQTPLDLARVPVGVVAAWRILGQFKPQVIFSTGGFVCVPTVIAGRWRRVPVVTHEQTALVGLANRVAARFADLVAISYESSRRYFPHAKRVVLTGNPVRQGILGGSADGCYRRFDFDPALPVVYVTGGAQGSHVINEAVGAGLTALLAVANVVHQCGNGPDGSGTDLALLTHRRDELEEQLQSRYAVLPFVRDELADIYAAASLVIGRAGAGTVNELATLGKPAILIPLASSAEGEQQRNAELMQASGGAIMLLEDKLTGAALAAQVRSLMADGSNLQQRGARAKSLAKPDAAREIVVLLRELAKALWLGLVAAPRSPLQPQDRPRLPDRPAFVADPDRHAVEWSAARRVERLQLATEAYCAGTTSVSSRIANTKVFFCKVGLLNNPFLCSMARQPPLASKQRPRQRSASGVSRVDRFRFYKRLRSNVAQASG